MAKKDPTDLTVEEKLKALYHDFVISSITTKVEYNLQIIDVLAFEV